MVVPFLTSLFCNLVFVLSCTSRLDKAGDTDDEEEDGGGAFESCHTVVAVVS